MIKVTNILAAIICLSASIICFVSGNIGLGITNFIIAALNITLAITLN